LCEHELVFEKTEFDASRCGGDKRDRTADLLNAIYHQKPESFNRLNIKAFRAFYLEFFLICVLNSCMFSLIQNCQKVNMLFKG